MPSPLDPYRQSARKLKKAFRAGETEASARLVRYIAPEKIPKHADFLHVIAREAGHDSWPKLKFALEMQALDEDQQAERLKIALYLGQHWRADRLLTANPALKDHNLGLQIALFDLESVEAAIDADPDSATWIIGIRTPILHLAYSRHLQACPEKKDAMLAIARLLIAHGADVNDGYPPEPNALNDISALYGALCHADNFALGEFLLKNGATPDDQESLYHATELGHTRALKLLMRYGVSTRGTNALPRALDFNDIEKVRLLLEYGADPNEGIAPHPSGQPANTIPALHQAARRWCSREIIALLLDHGADASAPWKGYTPYATACVYGNEGAALELASRGADTSLSPEQEALAECAAGRTASLDPASLTDEEKLMLTRIVFEPDRLEHLKALVSSGLDPNVTDEMGLTPLHSAAWAGLPDHVAYLLTLEPDLKWRNGYGGDVIGTALHGVENRLDRETRDHETCVRLLVEAGAELSPEDVAHCGDEKMAAFLEDLTGAG